MKTLIGFKGKARSRGFGSNLHLCNCAFDDGIRVGFSGVVQEGYSDPRQPGSRVRVPKCLSSLPCLRHWPALYETRPECFLTRVIARGSEPHQVLAGEPRGPRSQPQEPWFATFDSQGWPSWSRHSLLEGGMCIIIIYPLSLPSISFFLLFAKFKLVVLFVIVASVECQEAVLWVRHWTVLSGSGC